jgi:AcrR family transcriptional regulator
MTPIKARLHEQARHNVRQAIFDAARELFAQDGLAGVSMRGVADKIGYTPRTIYMHFADKDDLLSELIEEDVGCLADRLEATAAAETDPGRRLDAVARAYVAFGLENPHAYEAIFLQRSHPFTRQAADRQRHVQGERMLDVLARVAQESGRVAPGLDLQVVVQALRCTLHGVTSLLVLGRTLPGVKWETVVTHLVAGAVGEGHT